MVSINQVKCELCERSFKNVRALGNHIAWVHRISKEQYYCSFLRKSCQEGMCQCGSKTRFLDLGSGYRKFCSRKCSTNSKETHARYRATCIKRYGVENPNQSELIKDKKQNTCLKKYGVAFSFQSKETQEKKKRTCLERYGTDNPSKSEAVRRKYRETCLKRYGVENVSSLPEISKDKSGQQEHG